MAVRDVYIIGGSNSLKKDGWTAHLHLACPDVPFRNLSVGAATSLMGILRLLRDEVTAGATVVWEYGLNESNHFASGQSLDSLIHHTDWFMELCHRHSIRVLPLILWTRIEQARGKRNPYRKLLDERLTDRGLSPIDACELLQEIHDKSQDIREHFEGNMHYSASTPLLPLLANTVLEKLDSASVPSGNIKLAEKDLSLCYPDAPSTEFSNSVLDCQVYALDSDILIKAEGKLLASFVIAAMDAGAVTVGNTGTYSLQRPSGGPPAMRLLKHLVHWSAFEGMQDISRDIKISGCASADAVEVQNTFDWRGFVAGTPRKDAYIAALIEHAKH